MKGVGQARIMAHGGDRYRNRVDYDFSINVNPLGIPLILRKAMEQGIENAGYYPDPLQEASRRAAAEFYGERAGVSLPPEWMIPGNGASELIMAVVKGISPKKVLIPRPCFTGYLRAVRGNREDREGGDCEKDAIEWEKDLPDRIGPDTGLVILTNPGNPTGSLMDSVLLHTLLEKAKACHTPVLIDECFIEFTGKEAESGLNLQREFPNVLVLRAFTKIFAMPGVRSGCLICPDQELRSKIRMALPEWNLSSFAEAVLAAAGEHRSEIYAFMDETVRETTRLRNSMEERIRRGGFGDIRVFPSCTNYLLTTGWNLPGRRLFEELLHRGILVRSCEDMPPLTEDHIRLAVRPEAEQEMLFTALTEILPRILG